MRAVLLVVLTGCADYGLGVADPGPQDPGPEPTAAPPSLVVTPDSLHFDGLEPGDTAEQWLTLTNVGDGRLRIDDTQLELGGEGFDLGVLSGAFLAAGDSTRLRVGFTAGSAPSATDLARIWSTDEARPEVIVPLSAGTLQPRVELTPERHSFGLQAVGTRHELGLTVRSVGDAPLILTGHRFSSTDLDALALVAPPAPGTILEPGEELALTVAYTPYQAVVDESVLFVQSSDPTRPEVDAHQGGGAVVVPEWSFEITRRRPVARLGRRGRVHRGERHPLEPR